MAFKTFVLDFILRPVSWYRNQSISEIGHYFWMLLKELPTLVDRKVHPPSRRGSSCANVLFSLHHVKKLSRFSKRGDFFIWGGGGDDDDDDDDDDNNNNNNNVTMAIS